MFRIKNYDSQTINPWSGQNFCVRAKVTVVNIPSRQVEQEAFGEVVLIMETVDKAPSYSWFYRKFLEGDTFYE